MFTLIHSFKHLPIQSQQQKRYKKVRNLFMGGHKVLSSVAFV